MSEQDENGNGEPVTKKGLTSGDEGTAGPYGGTTTDPERIEDE